MPVTLDNNPGTAIPVLYSPDEEQRVGDEEDDDDDEEDEEDDEEEEEAELEQMDDPGQVPGKDCERPGKQLRVPFDDGNGRNLIVENELDSQNKVRDGEVTMQATAGSGEVTVADRQVTLTYEGH